MSEHALRRKTILSLRPLAAFAVENSAYPGSPDVSCTLCWIELKKVDRWPRGNWGKVKIELRPEQRMWLRRWCKAGGNAWVLIQVDQEYYLLHPTQVIDEDALTRKEIDERSAFYLLGWDGPALLAFLEGAHR